MITVGSLFSGIGGMELGLERTGKYKVIWNCEINPYCIEVLKKHWKDVPNLGDITKVNWNEIEKPELICGGFPCQDISIAGKGQGIKEGTRSGLWSEFAKSIRILRPKYALIENVPMLSKRGLNIVLADLAKMGYNAEWGIISASSVGAMHKRERIFIIAYSTGNRISRMWKETIPEFKELSWCKDIRRIEDLRNRLDIPEPLVCRSNNGVSRRLDNYIRTERTKAIGNAVVPQVAQTIGYFLLDFIDTCWEREEEEV
jgi:DNA (cytosine-5)-methyltransferase 1